MAIVPCPNCESTKYTVTYENPNNKHMKYCGDCVAHACCVECCKKGIINIVECSQNSRRCSRCHRFGCVEHCDHWLRECEKCHRFLVDLCDQCFREENLYCSACNVCSLCLNIRGGKHYSFACYRCRRCKVPVCSAHFYTQAICCIACAFGRCGGCHKINYFEYCPTCGTKNTSFVKRKRCRGCGVIKNGQQIEPNCGKSVATWQKCRKCGQHFCAKCAKTHIHSSQDD
jgi:hypothetical protein